MSKPAIPTVRTDDLNVNRALDAIKQTLDEVTGQARNVARFSPLPSNATLADVIARLNQITNRLQ
jgi:hypothetical protein